MNKAGKPEHSTNTILEAALDSVSRDALVEAVMAYENQLTNSDRHSVPIRMSGRTKAFYQALGAEMGISTSAAINLVLAGNISMTLDVIKQEM